MERADNRFEVEAPVPVRAAHRSWRRELPHHLRHADRSHRRAADFRAVSCARASLRACRAPMIFDVEAARSRGWKWQWRLVNNPRDVSAGCRGNSGWEPSETCIHASFVCERSDWSDPDRSAPGRFGRVDPLSRPRGHAGRLPDASCPTERRGGVRGRLPAQGEGSCVALGTSAAAILVVVKPGAGRLGPTGRGARDGLRYNPPPHGCPLTPRSSLAHCRAPSKYRLSLGAW